MIAILVYGATPHFFVHVFIGLLEFRPTLGVLDMEKLNMYRLKKGVSIYSRKVQAMQEEFVSFSFPVFE